MPVELPIVLDGTPFERGLTHGRLLREPIRRLVARWSHRLELSSGIPASGLVGQFLAETDFQPAIKEHTPGLLEEVAGIAEGAGIDGDTMFAFQLLDELLVANTGMHESGCSSIGVSPRDGRPAAVAQNWDIRGYFDGFQTVFLIEDAETGIRSFVFSYAGFVGAFGLNDRSVAVGVNSIAQLNHSNGGLPVAFVIRGLLAQTDGAGAANFLRRIPHASPQNYLIGDPGTVQDFECSANRVVQYSPDSPQELICHTNHAMVNDDATDRHLARLRHDGPSAFDADNSHTRLKTLYGMLEGSDATLGDIERVLQSREPAEHPVCMSFNGDDAPYSLASTIMQLADPPQFRIALGSPDTVQYQCFEFPPSDKE